MSRLSRRRLIASVPVVVLAAPHDASSGVPAATEAALRHYAAVMDRRDASAASDEAVEAWCDDEIEAVQALADAPAGDLRTLLQLVRIVGARVEEEQRRSLMDCEVSLILTVGRQAKGLLGRGAAP